MSQSTSRRLDDLEQRVDAGRDQEWDRAVMDSLRWFKANLTAEEEHSLWRYAQSMTGLPVDERTIEMCGGRLECSEEDMRLVEEVIDTRLPETIRGRLQANFT